MIVVGVEEETVPIAPDAADGECQLVCNDGAADEGLALTSVPLATTQLARLGPVERRPTRLEFDRTARGVAAVEGPLWPTQHFEPRDIEEVEKRTIDARLINVVNVNTNGRIEVDSALLLPGAPQHDARIIGTARRRRNDNSRYLRRYVFHARHLSILQHIHAEGRHGDRRRLNRRLIAFCGDRHLGQLARRFGGRAAVGSAGVPTRLVLTCRSCRCSCNSES